MAKIVQEFGMLPMINGIEFSLNKQGKMESTRELSDEELALFEGVPGYIFANTLAQQPAKQQPQAPRAGKKAQVEQQPNKDEQQSGSPVEQDGAGAPGGQSGDGADGSQQQNTPPDDKGLKA